MSPEDREHYQKMAKIVALTAVIITTTIIEPMALIFVFLGGIYYMVLSD